MRRVQDLGEMRTGAPHRTGACVEQEGVNKLGVGDSSVEQADQFFTEFQRIIPCWTTACNQRACGFLVRVKTCVLRSTMYCESVRPIKLSSIMVRSKHLLWCLNMKGPLSDNKMLFQSPSPCYLFLCRFDLSQISANVGLFRSRRVVLRNGKHRAERKKKRSN